MLPLPTSTPLVKSPVQTPSTTTQAPKKHKQEKSFAFISHSVQTFPSQEPSIDNAPLARRKRRRTSPNELNILNQEFLIGSTPNKLRRIQIAAKVSMSEKAVQIWFQNKRQSIRKQSINDKEITELPPTPDVSMNSSMSLANSTLNTSVISSTPIKPALQRSKSFASPDPIRMDSPIQQRSLSQASLPMKLMVSTPNSSFDDELFILQETKKKQPILLNNSNSSTHTFKLGKFKVHNDKEPATNKIQNLLNSVADERVPLAEVSSNVVKKRDVKHEVSDGVQSLLSLRGGNWK